MVEGLSTSQHSQNLYLERHLAMRCVGVLGARGLHTRRQRGLAAHILEDDLRRQTFQSEELPGEFACIELL